MANSIGHVSDNATQAEQLAQHTADALPRPAASRKVQQVAGEMHQIENSHPPPKWVAPLGQRASGNQGDSADQGVADQTNLWP